MLQRLKRRPGGQPNNRNAVKTGRWTKEGRAAHQAACEARQAAWAEEQRKFAIWSAPILARCKLQHAEILKQIERERAERALTEPELWGPVD